MKRKELYLLAILTLIFLFSGCTASRTPFIEKYDSPKYEGYRRKQNYEQTQPVYRRNVNVNWKYNVEVERGTPTNFIINFSYSKNRIYIDLLNDSFAKILGFKMKVELPPGWKVKDEVIGFASRDLTYKHKQMPNSYSGQFSAKVRPNGPGTVTLKAFGNISGQGVFSIEKEFQVQPY